MVQVANVLVRVLILVLQLVHALVLLFVQDDPDRAQIGPVVHVSNVGEMKLLPTESLNLQLNHLFRTRSLDMSNSLKLKVCNKINILILCYL